MLLWIQHLGINIMKRKKYNQGSQVGGSIGRTTHKKIGDLDLSLSGSAYKFTAGQDATRYEPPSRSSGVNTSITARKGPLSISHMRGADRFNEYKANYSNTSLGVNTKAGRFGTDKRGNVSYSTTTKGGTTISARANNKGGSLSIFKEL